MSYPHTIVNLSFGGAVYGDNDVWNCNLKIGNPTRPVAAEVLFNDQDTLDAIGASLEEWFTSQNSQISDNASLNYFKLAMLDTEGKYATGPDGDFLFALTVDLAGRVGGYDVNLAPQLTVAHTLDTGARRGLAKSGRIYPPMNGAVGGNGKLQNATAMATSFQTLINDLNAALANLTPEAGVGDQIVVASKERTGAIRYVQSVRVGDVVDTQRRRRSGFEEVYSAADITVYPGADDNTE